MVRRRAREGWERDPDGSSRQSITPMKKKPTPKTKRPAKRNTKKKTQVTAKDVPESRPASISRAAQSKATDPMLVFESESWKEKEEEMERLIAENPRSALQVACVGLDYSLELIWRLIEKKSLLSPIPPVFMGKPYNIRPSDDAALSLSNRILRIMEKVSRHALAGDKDMIITAWNMATDFAKTIHDIALDHPDRLESLAKKSVFMPSLRARPKNFEYDFPEIAEKTHLSEECLFDARDSSKHYLDTPATRLAADIVQYMAARIFELKSLKTAFTFIQQGAASGVAACQKFAGWQLEKWLLDYGHVKSYELHYDELPPLTRKTVPDWWNKAIKGEVERRFESIKGTAFHSELQKATDGQDYQVRDELKRRCHQALKSLARPDPKD